MARCSKSVGMISLKSTDNESPKYVATAWIIAKKENEAYIMTNYHVISAVKKRKEATQKETKLVIQFDHRTLAQPICPEFEVQMLENEISNNDLDYAILKVNDNLPGKETLKVTRCLPDSGVVSIIGFPNGQPKQRYIGKLYSVEDVKLWVKENTSDRCPEHPWDGRNTKFTCQHNYDWSKFERRKNFLLAYKCGTAKGVSGSPILNNSGEVCGLQSWGLFLRSQKKCPTPLFEFGHKIRDIIDNIKGKDETFAIELFG